MAYKSSPSSSASPESPRASASWQNMLSDACKSYRLPEPVFELMSDRRGGRTAWSSRVMINSQSYAARFWYDGKNLNNAKEDAAEVALREIRNANSPASPSIAWANRNNNNNTRVW